MYILVLDLDLNFDDAGTEKALLLSQSPLKNGYNLPF